MIRHVLLDADGVVQTLPDGWRNAAAARLPGGGIALLEELLVAERASLRGEGDFLPVLRSTLLAHGVEVDPDEFYRESWNSIEPAAEVLDMIGRLRAAGYGVHLGTNQHPERATYMREVLGYDGIFDLGCYSCDLGAAKPDAEFFRRAVALIGVPAAEVLFIDDKLDNVEAARAAGLAAEHWELALGTPVLQQLLAAHGVDPR